MIGEMMELPFIFMQGVIFSSPLFIDFILPFVLVFTIVFAVLQKTSILGKGKKQIDALVALVIALITISFANAVGIITSLIPFLVVSLFVILVFLILYGMAFQGDKKLEIGGNVQIAIGIIVLIAVVIAVLISTGAWEYIKTTWLAGGADTSLMSNFIIVIVIIIALAFAFWGSGKKEEKS